MFPSDLRIPFKPAVLQYSSTAVVPLYHSKPTDIPSPLLQRSYLYLPPLPSPCLPYSLSTLHPHVIDNSAPVSSLLPLAAWPSLSASFYRCTRSEISNWVVTEITWKCHSLLTPLLAKGNPSISRTRFADTSSTRSPPTFPRRPTFFTVRLVSLSLRSSKNTRPGRVQCLCLRTSDS